MKVAFYFGALNRGGAETLALDILTKCRSLNFETVCLYRNDGVLSKDFSNTGTHMLRVARKRSWTVYLWHLCRAIRKNEINIIHAQTSLNAILAVICSWFTGVKVVTTFHGFSFVNSPSFLRKIILKGSDRIIFVSEHLRDTFLKKGDFGCSDKCHVVYNGINFEKFALPVPGYRENGCLKMCMVGSFGEGRNHMLVCRFLQLLKSEGVDFHFTFIGAARQKEMNLYNECVEYCNSHNLAGYVTFAGLCNNVPELLQDMDAFVYSTRHDSFGIAVIEAIAAGVPTFVNDWCVMNEITQGGRWATLYKSDDELSLLQVFKEFISDRKGFKTRALTSSKEVRDTYSIKRHIDSLTKVYSEILNPDTKAN
jgi:glycosyltransferase involved in cell wall biosynthesis